MEAKSKLGTGSVLAVIGGLGIILGGTFGLTDLPGHWSFIAGFLFGVCGGLGATLVIPGFLSLKRSK